MRGAILVAVLFRTLDAWRIFDTVFVMTAGAHGTETLSFLAYRQTITLLELGLGFRGLGVALRQRAADRRGVPGGCSGPISRARASER